MRAAGAFKTSCDVDSSSLSAGVSKADDAALRVSRELHSLLTPFGGNKGVTLLKDVLGGVCVTTVAGKLHEVIGSCPNWLFLTNW